VIKNIKQMFVWKLNSAQEDAIVDSMRENGEKEIVYNLKINLANEYFANGILVHNCDSLAYSSQICRKPYESIYDDNLIEDKPLYGDIGL
jgi:hypothetical protein